jgi:hypothetical protein
MTEQDANVLEVLIGEMGQYGESIPFSAKRWAYSDMPRPLSQSVICCIAGPVPITGNHQGPELSNTP